MRTLFFCSLMVLSSQAIADEATPTPPPPTNPEAVDISDIEHDYWRPNKDELEVIQNRRFEKAKKFETTVLYGLYQGSDYVNTRALGGAVTYNLTNEWFLEASYLKMSNTDNDLQKAFRTQFGTAPDFNQEQNQE